MTPEKWKQAKDLFHDALVRPEAEQAAFLKSAGADPQIVAEVERLLLQHKAARTFLETPAAAAIDAESLVSASRAPASARATPETIGPYRIFGVVGEGGMGVVYLAEQESPRRRVALKVIRPGLASDGLFRRFEHEARALARLQHPGIAQIYHAGADEGASGRRPYFAMELVEGEPLLAYAASRALDARDRIGLFIRVCEAVQHAHMKGVIHRDLKPGNIIVGADGQPKVLDFGVARLTDADLRAATVRTDAGQIVGTVPYMSPEQVAGDAEELDTRSDVYSLGVVLYELLAGRLPYDLDRKSIIEAARLIREQAPARLSTVARPLRGDLDIILGKALEKDKRRRYQSAGDLAADLGRFLRREPILARPPSAGYQVRKFASRNRALVGAAAAVALVLVVSLVGVLHQRNEARRQAARTARINTFFMEMLNSASPERTGGKELTVRAMLDEAALKLDRAPAGDPLIDEEVRSTLGQTYWQLGELDKAEPLLRASAERAEAALGPDNSITLASLNTLALVLNNRGMAKDAGPLLERVYRSYLRQYGERSADTLSAMNNWARWLDAHGRRAEGLPLMERVVRLREEVLGPDDRRTLISVDNLGKVLLNDGRTEEAERHMRRANEGFRRTLGEDDPDTCASYQNLAELMRKQQRFPEAEELARLAAEGRRRVLGMDNRFTLYSINSRGRILMDQQRALEAEPFLRESLDGIRRVSTPGEPFIVGWGLTYANCLTSLRRFEEARALLQEIESGIPAISGEQGPSNRRLAEAFAALYTAWDRPADAEVWRSRLTPGK